MPAHRATRPSTSASYSAASSTIPPRAALTMRTVGLTLCSASSPMRPIVSGVLGRCTVMKSLGQQLVEAHHPDAHLGGARGLHVGVVGDELDAERAQPLRDEHADAAEADDADHLVGQLDAGVLRALPLPPLSASLAGAMLRARPAAARRRARRPRRCWTSGR
jgi:hypothetical protein